MYSSSFPNFLDDSVPTNINSNSNEATNHHQGLNETLDLSHDYITTQIVANNYLSNELLHHNMTNKKQLDVSYSQSKDQNVIIYGDSHSPSPAIITNSVVMQQQQPSLINLSQKYSIEYQSETAQLDDSDKSECESDFMSSKHAKQNLPHKKRIAKKLNSSQSQPYFSIVMPEDVRVVTNQFECNICGACLIDQLQFFMHLKEHYEPEPLQQKTLDKRRDSEMEIHVSRTEENLIENLEDSVEHIKDEEVPNVIDEFNEFSDPEDVMEDLRKEVEKVGKLLEETVETVETIGENETRWNYQASDEIEPEDHEQNETMLYSDNLNSLDTNYEEIRNAEIENEEMIDQDQPEDNMNYESEDEDDDKPLEHFRQESLRQTTKFESETTKKLLSEDDKEDRELTECLKKIHNFKCGFEFCGKAFNSRTALGYHLKTHSVERRYVCDQCGKKFLTNGALKVHLRLHSDSRPYECKFADCGKSFRQWGDLRYHETSIHSNKKDHVCEFCAKAFARKYSLVIHRRIHTGERNYKCTECDKSFRASSYLLNHKRIHTGEKPYICSVASCQKKFRVVGDLKRHMKIHDRFKTGAVTKEKKANVNKKDPTGSTSLNGEECVDLSFKEEDKSSSTQIGNSQTDIYVKPEKEVSTPKKGRRTAKQKKAK